MTDARLKSLKFIWAKLRSDFSKIFIVKNELDDSRFFTIGICVLILLDIGVKIAVIGAYQQDSACGEAAGWALRSSGQRERAAAAPRSAAGGPAVTLPRGARQSVHSRPAIAPTGASARQLPRPTRLLPYFFKERSYISSHLLFFFQMSFPCFLPWDP